jgi:hypothetical protein
VTGDGFDRLFTLLEGQRIPLRDTGGELLLEREDPKLTLRLSLHGDDQELTIPELDETYFFGNRRSLYAVQENRLLRCSLEFQDKLYPVLESGSSQLVFTSKNMADFCSYVLPEIDPFVTWEDPEDLLNRYLPDECTACFYFDMREDDLFAQLKFRYGEREIPAGAAARQAKGIRRDQRREQQAHDALDRYFDQEGPDGFLLRGEEEIYDFLTDTLPQFPSTPSAWGSPCLTGASPWIWIRASFPRRSWRICTKACFCGKNSTGCGMVATCLWTAPPMRPSPRWPT